MKLLYYLTNFLAAYLKRDTFRQSKKFCFWREFTFTNWLLRNIPRELIFVNMYFKQMFSEIILDFDGFLNKYDTCIQNGVFVSFSSS